MEIHVISLSSPELPRKRAFTPGMCGAATGIVTAGALCPVAALELLSNFRLPPSTSWMPSYELVRKS